MVENMFKNMFLQMNMFKNMVENMFKTCGNTGISLACLADPEKGGVLLEDGVYMLLESGTCS